MLTSLDPSSILRSTFASPRSLVVADTTAKCASDTRENWRSTVSEAVELPPSGFGWGETFVFDQDGTAVPVVGRVVPTKVTPKATIDEIDSWYDASETKPPQETNRVDIDELDIGRRIGQGTQCEVRLGELPGHSEPVAVKVGKESGAVAIAREAVVLSAMLGEPGFPTLLHHEEPGPDTPGGALILGLLGPSLYDVLDRPTQGVCVSSSPPTIVSEPTLRRVGGQLLSLLRRMHRAGFVHNDLKPANILLNVDAEEIHSTSRLHLIDFGSCTRIVDHECADVGRGDLFARDAQASGPGIGSPIFASVAADECDAHSCTTHPLDDVESLVYTLAYLAAGSLPWHDQPAALMASTKRELLKSSSSTATALTDGVDSATIAATIQALYEEVKRCQSERREGGSASVDYDACYAILGG